MKKCFSLICLFFLSLVSSLGSVSLKNDPIVVFKDSTVNKYKLMSFKMKESNASLILDFTSRKGISINEDFSGVHSLNAYVNSTQTLTLEITYLSSQVESEKLTVELKSGRGYQEIILPYPDNATNPNFDISKVNGIKFHINTSKVPFEIDEFSFNYFEPETEKQGPDEKIIKKTLNKEKERRKKRQRKEKSSDVFRKQKEYESR